MGTGPSAFSTTVTGGSDSLRSMWCSVTDGMGEATAATSRMVRTVTSRTPSACNAATAPRAVLPKPMTTAVSGRPYAPVAPTRVIPCSTEQ